MNNFTTIYFKDSFNIDSIDIWMLNDLFPTVAISLGRGQYINVYTKDKALVHKVADELRYENIERVVY